jgi:hypothetical protein
MIFTLPTAVPRYTQAPILYLDQFFPNNTLLLLDQDTDINKLSHWQDHFELIKRFVTDNSIQVIVIHAGINPVKLDEKYGWDHSQDCHAPTFLELQQQLSTLATTYILTGDFFYYNNPAPNIIFFPVFVWLNSARRMREFFAKPDSTLSTERANTVYDIDFEPKTKTLMCLNSNPVWHRIYLFSLLIGKPWIRSIGYSFRARVDYQSEIKFQDRLTDLAVTLFMSPEEIAVARHNADQLPITLAQDNTFDSNKSSVDGWIYRSYAINLVTETSLTEGVMFTEKTCKPFTAYQIPVLIAPPGSTQFLEDLGLDMFADYIPWRTWDSVADHKLRIRMIVQFVDSILANPDAILTTHQGFADRLIKNKLYFHSAEFQNILLKQIKSCS